MAYIDKYFFIKKRDGHEYKLVISEKDPSGHVELRYLSLVQDWDLQVSGNNGLIAPIMKSQCDITLVDAPDVVQDVRIDGQLYEGLTGGYEEFYTSDATKYKVTVFEDDRARWTGFITPDSFEENLNYHSTVSITARDNVGHLNDFPFDIDGGLYGVVSVRELVTRAISLIGGMSLDLSYNIPLWASNGANKANVLDTFVNVDIFQDKTWYDALEGVLDSLGLALRWNDNNCFIIVDIGHMRTASRPSFYAPNVPITFIGNSGHRSLDPAVRRVVDQLDYKTGALYKGVIREADYISGMATINGVQVQGTKLRSATGWYSIGLLEMNARHYQYAQGRDGGYMDDSSIFLPVFRASYMSNNNIMYRDIYLNKADDTLNLSFDLATKVFYGNDTTGALCWASLRRYSYALAIRWAAVSEINGTNYYYLAERNAWVTDFTFNEENILEDNFTEYIRVSNDIPLMQGMERVEIRITGILSRGSLSGVTLLPGSLSADTIMNQGKLYGVIRNVEITLANEGDYSGSKVTTIYNDDNNVVLSRNPMLGQVPEMITHQFIKNGIYLPTAEAGIYVSALEWQYGLEDNPVKRPLAVWIAQQLLTQYYKPQSILTGDLIDMRHENPMFSSQYIWRGRRFLLTSGRLDMLSGAITSATLREVHNYTDLWEDGGEPTEFIVDISHLNGPTRID